MVHPGGRPSVYKPEYAEQAAKLCALGATNVELADFFRVTISTVHNWKVRHPEFLDAIKVAKDAADSRVERSLYERANGYTFDSEKIFQFKGTVIRAKSREHVPPESTAIIFWLKNRQPEKWRDRQDLAHSGTIQHEYSGARERLAHLLAAEDEPGETGEVAGKTNGSGNGSAPV